MLAGSRGWAFRFLRAGLPREPRGSFKFKTRDNRPTAEQKSFPIANCRSGEPIAENKSRETSARQPRNLSFGPSSPDTEQTGREPDPCFAK
jgi:hypothetical protein